MVGMGQRVCMMSWCENTVQQHHTMRRHDMQAAVMVIRLETTGFAFAPRCARMMQSFTFALVATNAANQHSARGFLVISNDDNPAQHHVVRQLTRAESLCHADDVAQQLQHGHASWIAVPAHMPLRCHS